jgi:TolA-binding protein
MARWVTIALVIILAAVATSADADEYNLYKPQKVQSPEIPAPGDGVLTRTIVIREGDTLSKLSRKFSGRSSFFPQILLFNRISNPDLIYAGKTLRIPLTRGGAEAEQGGETGQGTVKAKVTRSGNHKWKAKREYRSSPRTAVGMAGKQLFSRGMRAYAKGHYRNAIDIFDSYLTSYPNSADASEAALYKAECYMKLSGGR